MRGGDLSNKVPRRVLVDLEIVARVKDTRTVRLNRRLKRWVKVADEYEIDRGIMSMLLRKSVNLEVMLECFGIGIDQHEIDAVIERMERMGQCPFPHGDAFAETGHLASLLPYRPEVVGVYSTTPARYGSWAIDLARVG